MAQVVRVVRKGLGLRRVGQVDRVGQVGIAGVTAGQAGHRVNPDGHGVQQLINDVMNYQT